MKITLSELALHRVLELAEAQEKAPEFVLADLVERAFDAPEQLNIPTMPPCSSHTTAPTVEAFQQFLPPS